MGTLRNKKFSTVRGNTFPITHTLGVTSATYLKMMCEGSSAIEYKFIASGDVGSLTPGESVEFVANSDPITDSIEMTFNAPGSLEFSWSIGVGSGGGGAAFDSPTHQEVTNPAALVVSGWNKLSFVCSGAITVTLDGNDIIYPQTLGAYGVLGETIEASGVTLNAITFDGTGTLLLTIKE